MEHRILTLMNAFFSQNVQNSSSEHWLKKSLCWGREKQHKAKCSFQDSWCYRLVSHRQFLKSEWPRPKSQLWPFGSVLNASRGSAGFSVFKYLVELGLCFSLPLKGLITHTHCKCTSTLDQSRKREKKHTHIMLMCHISYLRKEKKYMSDIKEINSFYISIDHVSHSSVLTHCTSHLKFSTSSPTLHTSSADISPNIMKIVSVCACVSPCWNYSLLHKIGKSVPISCAYACLY